MIHILVLIKGGLMGIANIIPGVSGGTFALILGIFVGLAAFFGGFMNMNYLLSGTVSTNPMLLAIAILLVLAWKTAGWWGLDRWLLGVLGTPWRPGYIFKREERLRDVESEPSQA